MTALLAAHAAATWALVGLIWTVQLVHYPLFAQVGADTFRSYHARHTRQITWIVAPLVAIELLTAAILFLQGAREPWLLASFAPLAFNWLATWRVQIPLHDRLAAGFDAEVHRRLVASNWWRTAAWSIRGGCVLYGAFSFAGPQASPRPAPEQPRRVAAHDSCTVLVGSPSVLGQKETTQPRAAWFLALEFMPSEKLSASGQSCSTCRPCRSTPFRTCSICHLFRSRMKRAR